MTRLRFYKGAGNPGPHVANLWTNGGTPLASPLRMRATNAATPNTAFNNITGTQLNLLSWSAPISNNAITLQFQQPIAAEATGSFAVGIEGYRNITLMQGTMKETVVRDAGVNKVTYFSVDGSRVQPRRQVDRDLGDRQGRERPVALHRHPQPVAQSHYPERAIATRRRRGQVRCELGSPVGMQRAVARPRVGVHRTQPRRRGHEHQPGGPVGVAACELQPDEPTR